MEAWRRLKAWIGRMARAAIGLPMPRQDPEVAAMTEFLTNLYALTIVLRQCWEKMPPQTRGDPSDIEIDFEKLGDKNRRARMDMYRDRITTWQQMSRPRKLTEAQFVEILKR